MKSNEHDLRMCIVHALINSGVNRDDIRLEIPLDTASSEGRADIVVLSKDSLVCIELKSGKDKWCGVNIVHQCEQYRRAFDSVAVIVDHSHRKNIKHTDPRGNPFLDDNWRRVDFTYYHDLKMIGNDVHGVPKEDPFFFQKVINRRTRKTGVYEMARILWRSEIQSTFGTKKGKSEYVQILREEATLKSVREAVIACLRTRPLNQWEFSFWGKFDACEANQTASYLFTHD